jgi:NAD-dependent dihydropyrimidine dehydrogenase PreA subunit
VALVLALLALAGGLVMVLWNAIGVTTLGGGHPLDYLHAVGLLVLCRLLVGGIGGRGSGHRRAQWEEWQTMSQEERGALSRRGLGADDRGATMPRSDSRPDCHQEPGRIEPVVDFSKCEGQGDCIGVCPESVFEMRRIGAADYAGLPLRRKFKLRVHGMQVAYTPNADACRSCSLCVSACPEQAITLRRTGSVP